MVEWGNELLVAHVQTAKEADGGVAVDPADLATPRFVFHMAPFNSVDHLHLYVTCGAKQRAAPGPSGASCAGSCWACTAAAPRWYAGATVDVGDRHAGTRCGLGGLGRASLSADVGGDLVAQLVCMLAMP